MIIHETFDLPSRDEKVQKKIENVEEKARDKFGVYSELADKIEEIDLKIRLIDPLMKEKIEKINEINKLIDSNYHHNDIDISFSFNENERLQLVKIKLENEINHVQAQKEKLISEKNSLINSN